MGAVISRSTCGGSSIDRDESKFASPFQLETFHFLPSCSTPPPPWRVSLPCSAERLCPQSPEQLLSERICAIRCKNGLVIALLYMRKPPPPPSSQYRNYMAVRVGSGGCLRVMEIMCDKWPIQMPISIFRSPFSVDDPHAPLKPINHSTWVILSKAK